jgi:JmjC domain, hydroxylase
MSNAESLISPNERYANHHIPSFLALSREKATISTCPGAIQIVFDGSQLTADALERGALDISRPILVKDTPESIGMTVFHPLAVQQGLEDKVTIRHVADVIGHHWPVRVMDVEHQEELHGWTLGDLVHSFEDEGRLRFCDGSNSNGEDPKLDENKQHSRSTDSHFAKRKAAAKACQSLISHQNRPRTLNQISLEFSQTKLASRVKSPQFVRDLAWQYLKPSDTPVQYYCLTSQQGCYTDFHVDFGGSHVWYHVLSGVKMFCLISPTKANLRIYEEWLGHQNQASIFLPNLIKNPQEVLTVNLCTSQTLSIPTGWIHAVYTPEDAIVLGGNFLHGFDIAIQLETNEIEERTRVVQSHRFPYFKDIHFCAGASYLQKLRAKTLAKRELDNIPDLLKALERWHDEMKNPTTASTGSKNGHVAAALHAATINGCSSVEEFLQALREEFEKVKSGTETRPRLSIRLPGIKGMPPSSPRDCLLVAEAMSGNEGTKLLQDQDSFRIIISSAAQELHQPLPRTITKTNPRKDDLNFVDCHDDDDDWIPAAERRKVQQKRSVKKRESVSGGRHPIADGVNASNKRAGPTQVKVAPVHTRSPPAKKAKTSARQRLLKKIR